MALIGYFKTEKNVAAKVNGWLWIETYVNFTPNVKINIGDSWKEIKIIKINIGDSWKQVKGFKINVGDSWKDVLYDGT